MFPASAPPRRVRCEQFPGVYKRGVRKGPGSRETYEITYRDATGRQRWETVPGAGAKDAHELRCARIACVAEARRATSGKPASPDEAYRMTFEIWVRQHRASARTMAEYERNARNHVVPRFGDTLTRRVSARDIDAWLNELRRSDYAEDSLRNFLKPVRLSFQHAVERGVIEANPCVGLRTRLHAVKRTRVLTSNEMEALLAAVSGRYRTAALLMLFTGVRISELCALWWEDVDLIAGEVHVRVQLEHASNGSGTSWKRPKTSAGVRTLPLAPAVVRELRGARSAALFSGDEDYVLATGHRTPMSPDNLRRAFRKEYARLRLNGRAGSDRLVVHSLRHTFATVVAGSDPAMTLPMLMDLLGHGSLSSTVRYVHAFNDAARRRAFGAAQEDRFGWLRDGATA